MYTRHADWSQSNARTTDPWTLLCARARWRPPERYRLSAGCRSRCFRRRTYARVELQCFDSHLGTDPASSRTSGSLSRSVSCAVCKGQNRRSIGREVLGSQTRICDCQKPENVCNRGCLRQDGNRAPARDSRRGAYVSKLCFEPAVSCSRLSAIPPPPALFSSSLRFLPSSTSFCSSPYLLYDQSLLIFETLRPYFLRPALDARGLSPDIPRNFHPQYLDFDAL